MGGANGKLKEKYEYVMVKNAAGKSIKKQLGSGSYGVVHLVKRKADNQQVALKTIDKTAAELKVRRQRLSKSKSSKTIPQTSTARQTQRAQLYSANALDSSLLLRLSSSSFFTL